MNLEEISKLLKLVETKSKIDQQSDWFSGSRTYFDALREELDEVEQELDADKRCYLEDELADVFWDFLNLLYNLETENKINLANVFTRAHRKYDERLEAIQNKDSWANVKARQKVQLAKEQLQLLPQS